MTIAKKDESAERKNSATQKPAIFYAKHMQPGICGYEKETVLVDIDAMKRMIPTGTGIPIYVLHQNVDLSTMKDKACGYVTDSFYNELDGFAWFKILIVDEEGFEAIAKSWKVSNAYVPKEWGVGGKKNNCDYHREVMDGGFTHLAIVPDPRYEDADIFTPEEFKAYQEIKKRELAELQNSLAIPPKGKPSMFKFFRNKIEEVTNAADATHVEVEGKQMTVAEAMELLNGKMKKNESDEDCEKRKKMEAMENELVDIDGEIIPLKEFKNRFSAMKANEKKNAEDEAEKKKKDDEEKKNSDEKAKKDKEEEEKKNAAHFEELRNANLNAPITKSVVIDTGMDKVQRGQNRYGTQH